MIDHLPDFIKQKALSLGFDACGIAKAEHLAEDEDILASWLSDHRHGTMSFMENNVDKRVDPRKLVEGCKSVVVVLLNYFPARKREVAFPGIAKYAYSETDYHYVVKKMLGMLEDEINQFCGAKVTNSDMQHTFVDSAPVLERRWAQKAGLGWIGKNKQLIGTNIGSFCFIGTLMLNVDLSYDAPIKDRCGNCTKCIDSCPTHALNNNILDATQCISYHTIENKDEIPENLQPQLSGYIVGCDICADVCPWNNKWAIPTLQNRLQALPEIIEWTDTDWQNLTGAQYKRIFKNTALSRVSFRKLKYNLKIASDQRTNTSKDIDKLY